jgi:hypothetical protein
VDCLSEKNVKDKKKRGGVFFFVGAGAGAGVG